MDPTKSMHIFGYRYNMFFFGVKQCNLLMGWNDTVTVKSEKPNYCMTMTKPWDLFYFDVEWFKCANHDSTKKVK